jgi:hypothetical protein
VQANLGNARRISMVLAGAFFPEPRFLTERQENRHGTIFSDCSELRRCFPFWLYKPRKKPEGQFFVKSAPGSGRKN